MHEGGAIKWQILPSLDMVLQSNEVVSHGQFPVCTHLLWDAGFH